MSDARKEISIRKDVINSGMHYFYAIDGDGNVSYASIEVYRLSFIANGTRIDVKYKANGYDASLTDIIPETDMYVFNKWQAESDGRTYTSDEKYLLNRNENFEATWTEAAAYVPSTNKYFITTQDAVDSIEENTADYVVVRLVRNETTSGVEITNGRKIAYEAGSNTLTKSTTGVAINSVKVASLTGSFKLADTTSTSDTAVRVLSGAAFKLVNGTISSDSYAIRNLGTFEIIGGTVNGKYGIYNNGHVVLGDGSIPFDRNSMSVIATAASYLEATDTATATYVNGSLIDHDTTYQVPTSRMTLREDFEIRKIDSTSNVVTTIIEDLVMTSAVTAGTTAKPVEVKVTLSCVNSSYTFQYSTDNTNWTTGTSVTLIDNATVYGRILDGDEVVNTEQLTIDNIVELTVTFNAQGIITNPSSAKVKYQRTYGSVIPNTTDTSDYWFDGWFTASSGGTQVTGDTIVTKTSDHTLYAHWTLKNQSPNAPTISLTSRGTTYINVKVTATDPDGDDIYYKITVDGSTYNTSTVASGQSSSKSIYSLDDFTTYTISAVTVDSLGAKSSATQYTFKTKCAGTENTCTNTWHCQGYTSTPIDCTNSECTLGRVLSVNCPGPTGSDVDCSNCTNGKVPYTCPGADTDCPYCCPGPNEPIEPGDYSECPDCHAAGKFWHRDWACSTCGSTGDGYYCESCGSTTGTTMNHNNQEDCTNCGGDGTIESAKCEHGYTDKHSGTTKCTATGCESGTIYAKCSHGNTEAHKEYTTCSTCGGSGNSGYNISSCEHGYDQQSHYYCDISGHGSYRGENDYHTYNYCSTHDEYGSHDG